MTLKEIRRQVQDIEKIRYDDESAHIAEDKLYHDFINYISKTGDREQKQMAKAILETDKNCF